MRHLNEPRDWIHEWVRVHAVLEPTLRWRWRTAQITHINWCCFYYFLRNGLVALLEALFARIFVRLNVCSYVFARVCLHVHVCTCVHAHTRTCAHKHTLSRLLSFLWRALSVGRPLCLILTKHVSMCACAHGCVQTYQQPRKAAKMHVTFTDTFFLFYFGIFKSLFGRHSSKANRKSHTWMHKSAANRTFHASVALRLAAKKTSRCMCLHLTCLILSNSVAPCHADQRRVLQYDVLQCGAVWCSMVQCGAVWYIVLQCHGFVTEMQVPWHLTCLIPFYIVT